MALTTTPEAADLTVFEGDCGSYYAWTSTKLPVLAVANLGAGKLLLKPRGFALPHYADSAKLGYVLQGTCTVGLISPDTTQENVLKITKGDVIPVPIGATSWWFNDEDYDLTIVFLGETESSYTPGHFNYFFLTGALGLLQGFSSEFIRKIYGIEEQDSVQKLVKSQTSALLLKLDDKIKMPDGSNYDDDDNKVQHVVRNARKVNADDYPVLEGVGLSGLYERLGPGSVFGPKCCFNGDMIVYVVKGSGRAEVLGLNGNLALDGDVKEGELFVVQRLLAVALVAGEEGLEFFAVNKSLRPVFGDFSGKLSVWRQLSSPSLQASLNVDAEFVEYFKSKINTEEAVDRKSVV